MNQNNRLYWVTGPWPGRMALAARPRGGDWMADEIADWKRQGVRIILSLLTTEEEQELDLVNEAAQAKAQDVAFLSFPILDREVPDSEEEFRTVLGKIEGELSSGKNVLVHCRHGIGRSGIVAGCLLTTKGLSPKTAMDHLSAARGALVPETPEQRRWIERYASNLATTK